MLVNPVIGAGGGFFFVFVDVHLEAFAIAAVLPVCDGVADAVEERAAAEIDPSDEHAAEMADVADVVATESECGDEFHRSHGNHIGTHTHFHRNRKHHYLAIRKKNGASEQHAEDGAGGADGRYISGWPAPKKRYFHDYVDDSRANAAQEVILQEATAAPRQLQLAPEHIQEEHIHEDVPNGGAVMQEQVGERLPDAQTRQNGRRHQSKVSNKPVVRGGPRKGPKQNLENIYRYVGNDQPLDRGRKVKIKAEPVVTDARARSHENLSLRRESARVKEQISQRTPLCGPEMQGNCCGLVELLAGKIKEGGREKGEHENAEKIVGRERSHQFGAEGEKIGAPGQTKNGCEPMRDAIGDFRVLQKSDDDAKQAEDASCGD